MNSAAIAAAPGRGMLGDERGAALPTVLLVLTLLLLLGAGAIAFASQGVDQARAVDATQVAQEMAENGLEAAKRELDENPQAALYDGDPSVTDSEWSMGKRLSFEGDDPGVVYALALIRHDPERSTATANFYRVTSSGHEGERQRRLAATVSVPKPVAGNSAPVGVADAATTNADTTVTLNVLENDSDPDGDPITLTSNTPPAHGSVTCTPTGDCLYTPAPGYIGDDAFSYAISDGRGGTADAVGVAIEVAQPLAPLNRPPEAFNDTLLVQSPASASLDPRVNDTDPDGDPLKITTPSPSWAGGTVSCSETSCTATPKADYGGSSSFAYTVTDGRGGFHTAYVAVTVNRKPVANADSVIVQVPRTLTLYPRSNDTDADGDALSITKPLSAVSLKNGAGTIVGSAVCSASSCTVDPADGANGSSSFSYGITDGKGGTDSATVAVAFNRPPVAVNDTPEVFERKTVDFNVMTLGSNDYDPDGDAVSFIDNSETAPVLTTDTSKTWGTLECGSTGICNYDPPGDNAGGTKATFTYKIKDARGNTDTGRVTITIKETPISSASTNCNQNKDTDTNTYRTAVKRSYGKAGGNDVGSYMRHGSTDNQNCQITGDITLGGTSYLNRTLSEWATLAKNQCNSTLGCNYRNIRSNLPTDTTATASISYVRASSGPTVVFMMMGDGNAAAETSIDVSVKMSMVDNMAVFLVTMDEYVVPG